MSEQNRNHGENNIPLNLLRDFNKWSTYNGQYGLSTYIKSSLTLENFFGVYLIICPKIKMHNGGLFLEENFTHERFCSWFRTQNGNMTNVEKVMNHRHIRDISPSLKEAPFELLESAGEILYSGLCCKLTVYKDMQTSVEIKKSENDIELTFFVVR